MLKVCHINVTSIKKHQDELYARFYDYDILSINETNLKPQQHLGLSGFNIFRNDRIDQTGGGVLLAIRERIKCHEILNKTVEKNEVIAVQIETSSGLLLVASLYIPPKAKIKRELFEELYQINNDCIILGDLNAALQSKGSRKTNAKGRQLQDLLEEGYLQCIDNELTTYERHEYEEKLDWIIASQPTLFFIANINTHSPLGLLSGHKPLTFELSAVADRKPMSPRYSYNFKSANWQIYRQKLNSLLETWDTTNQILTSDDIEAYTKFVTDCVVTASKAAIRPGKQTLKQLEPSTSTKLLIDQKHQAYRQWKKSKLKYAKKQYYKFKILVTNALRNERISRFKKLMSTLSTRQMHSAQVWATVRKFHNKRTKQLYASTINYLTQTASSDREKADLFAAYFENEVFVQTPNSLPFHLQVTEQTEWIKNKMKQSIKKPPQITEREIKKTLKQLQNSSPGPDDVHNRCIKNHTKSLVQHLAHLFNAVIKIGHIPSIWKRANIILILKPKKDKQQPSSYRPISLLSCLGKLLEKIIKRRLTAHLEERNILPVHQAGFRAGKSTMYNIVRLERYAREELAKRRHSAVIFFDIKAAFDSVWFDGLIYKLADLRLPEYLTRFVISFLNGRPHQSNSKIFYLVHLYFVVGHHKGLHSHHFSTLYILATR